MIKTFSTKRNLSKCVNRLYSVRITAKGVVPVWYTNVLASSRAQAKRIADDVYNKPVKRKGKA